MIAYADREAAEQAAESLNQDQKEKMLDASVPLLYGVDAEKESLTATFTGIAAYAIGQSLALWSRIRDHEGDIPISRLIVSVPRFGGKSVCAQIAWVVETKDGDTTERWYAVIYSMEQFVQLLHTNLKWLQGKERRRFLKEMNSMRLPERSDESEVIVRGRIGRELGAVVNFLKSGLENYPEETEK